MTDEKPQPGEGPIPENAQISPDRPPMRLMGSMPLARRQPNGDGEPPEPPHPPPPPPPPVSTPDIGMQFSPCLPDTLRGQVVSAIRSAMASAADVRVLCSQNTERIGIWLRAPAGDADIAARTRGLERLALLRSGETMAVFINSAMIRSKALDGWNAAPKRLGGSGNPDPGGPVHLTGFSVTFEAPNRVVTRIDGFDERPWPDVDFHLITTDTITASGGELQCQSKQKLDTDTSWLNTLTGIFTGLGVLVSGWFLLPAAVFLVQDIIVSSVSAPNVNAGAGCPAVGLVPVEILVPGGLKVVIQYRRAEVTAGGIFAGGIYVVGARSPSVSIVGPRQVAVNSDAARVSRNYSAATDDLRPPLQYRWTADGTVNPRDASSTTVAFSTSGVQVEKPLSKKVNLQVTDVDNLSAQASINVQVFLTRDTEDGLPPICRVKPWLPQCQNLP